MTQNFPTHFHKFVSVSVCLSVCRSQALFAISHYVFICEFLVFIPSTMCVIVCLCVSLSITHRSLLLSFLLTVYTFYFKKLTRKTELIAENGTRLPAITVFQLAIKSLKDDALAKCDNRLDGCLTVDEIHWTLTVPAIWKAQAKQFMREAGVKVCVI